MRRRAALLVVLCAIFFSGSAMAYLTGITGTPSATLARGATNTFLINITGDSAGDSNFSIYISASPGLSISSPFLVPLSTPGQCNTSSQRDGKDFFTCSGISVGANSTIQLSVSIIVHNDASSTETWVIQAVGAGLSGDAALVGTITVTGGIAKTALFPYPGSLVDAVAGNSTLGTGTAFTSIGLQNVGSAPAIVTVAVAAGSDFFGLDLAHGATPSFATTETVTMPAQSSSAVFINTKPVAAGIHVGSLNVSGDGITGTITVPIVLVVDSRPVGNPAPAADSNRFDVVSIGSNDGSATLTISNNGSGDVHGVLGSDVGWLAIPPIEVVVRAGQSATFTINIDPTKRPFLGQSGSIAGTVTLTYLLPASAKSGRIVALDSPGTATISVPFVSTVPPQVTSTPVPPQGNNTAILIPGVGHAVGSVGQFISDLVVFPQAGFGPPGTAENRALSFVDFYFTPLGQPVASAKKFTVSAIAPPSSVAFGDLVSTVFGLSQIGTLQVRPPDLSVDTVVGLNANVFNVSNRAGTYGTSIPIFIGAYAATATDKEYLAGLRKDATSHTNIYLQEGTGNDITASIDFYDASGTRLGSTSSLVPGFGAVQLGGNTVPLGTVSAVIGVASGSGGVHAYATPVDEASGDTWAVADWSRVYHYYSSFYNGVSLVVPVAGAAHGANNTYFKTDAAIMNVGSGPASGTLRYYVRGGTPIDKPISLNPLQTMVLNDVTTTFFGVATDSVGYLVYTPASGNVAITSRNYTTTPGSAATFGTAVPTVYAGKFNYGLNANQLRRIAGVEDSALTTVGAQQPATFRTNFGLIETGGKAATVQVSIYFNTNTDKTAVVQGGSATYTLGPNEFRLVGNIANAILGANRANYGDLHDITVEFKVIGGDGTVIPFVSSIDNGSGDSTFRLN